MKEKACGELKTTIHRRGARTLEDPRLRVEAQSQIRRLVLSNFTRARTESTQSDLLAILAKTMLQLRSTSLDRKVCTWIRVNSTAVTGTLME